MSRTSSSLNQYLVTIAQKYKIYCISLILISISVAIFNALVLYQIKNIIDTLSSLESGIIFPVLLYIFYKFTKHMVYFLLRIVDLRYAPKIFGEVTNIIYIETMNHSLHWFESRMSGDISSKIQNFAEGIYGLSRSLFSLITKILIVTVQIGCLFGINYIVGSIGVAFSVTYCAIMYKLLQKQMNLQKQYAGVTQEMFGTINDSIANVHSVMIGGSIANEIRHNIAPRIHKCTV